MIAGVAPGPDAAGNVLLTVGWRQRPLSWATDDFLRSPSTRRAGTDEVRVDVAASGTFDGVALKIFANQESLHFSQFQRAQNAAETGNAAAVATGLTERLFHEFAATVALPAIGDSLRVRANVVVTDMVQIGAEAADEGLAHVGMKLRLDQ